MVFIGIEVTLAARLYASGVVMAYHQLVVGILKLRVYRVGVERWDGGICRFVVTFVESASREKAGRVSAEVLVC